MFDSAYEGPASIQARPALRYLDQLPNGVEGSHYEIVTIEPTPAPEGCTGANWFVYRIARGRNEITGYRQGSRAAVKSEVNILVEGLNGRRHLGNVKPILVRRGRKGASATEDLN